MDKKRGNSEEEEQTEKERRAKETAQLDKIIQLREEIERYRVEKERDESSGDLATISRTVVDRAEELLDMLEPGYSSAVSVRSRASRRLGSLGMRGAAGRQGHVEEVGPVNGDSPSPASVSLDASASSTAPAGFDSSPKERGAPLETMRGIGSIALPAQHSIDS